MDYLRWGGIPEILLAEEPLRRKIITEYADLRYYRDLVDQFSVRNEHVMRLLLKHCLTVFMCPHVTHLCGASIHRSPADGG